MDLSVSVHLGDPAQVAVGGDLDLASAWLLEGLIHRFAARGRHVVLDLKDVAFMDCGGLGALLSIRRAIESRGGSLQLEHIAPAVRRVIELTGASLPMARTGRRHAQDEAAHRPTGLGRRHMPRAGRGLRQPCHGHPGPARC